MSEPVSVLDFEKHAFRVLPKNALDYYKSGAGKQETLLENRRAFSELRIEVERSPLLSRDMLTKSRDRNGSFPPSYKIRPRCLRNVSHRDLSTTALGQKVSIPIGISPTAMQRMAHPEGECANARAAQAMGAVFILSTIATSSIEEVAEAAPKAIKWFQLYIYNDREVTKSLVKRAEAAGFRALVLTVDTPMFGLRLADLSNKFALPPHLRLANFEGNKSTDINTKSTNGSGLNDYANALFDASLEWKDIEWLKSITTLPIILKGILTAEDAILAADIGVAGVLVSNHGARQVDGTPASIEALPEIVKAVGHRLEVFLDGGVTDGTDVFKALALGARMVFVGRPALWGLAYGGEDGVKKVLEILKNEFEYALAISGCASVGDIKPCMVVHRSYYAKM